MLDTVSRYLISLVDDKGAYNLQRIFNPLADRYSSLALNTAGLVINAGASPLAKIGAADCYLVVRGILVKIAAGTAMPALTGINAPAGGFNVAMFFVDSAGVVTVAGGAAGATLGAVQWPQFPVGKALIGFLIITNAGAFTGGTTALDGGTTIYISPTLGGGFDPTVLL